MKNLHLILWIIVLCLSSACRTTSKDQSDLMVGGREVGGFKGLTTVEAILKGRLFKDPNYFTMAGILDQSNMAGGLSDLLGAYNAANPKSKLENASPNAVNVLLWKILMTEVAKSLATFSCFSDTQLEMHFAEAAKHFCTEDIAASERSILLQRLWLAIMRYDAPRAEMDQWIDEIQKDDSIINNADRHFRLKNLYLSILMNPYFLLEH